MKILFKNIEHIYGTGRTETQPLFLLTEGDSIAYIGNTLPSDKPDRVIDCKDKLVLPGLYNCHTHVAMTLFRGYGEDLPLSEWLTTKIFPAEDKLTEKSVYTASLFSCLEMIKNGIVSFSDMYFFCDQTVKAATESGLKANISRAIVSFPGEPPLKEGLRFREADKLYKTYHNSANGRIKIDMAIHAEYTNTEEVCREFSSYVKECGAILHIHLSETEKEHLECLERHKKTPAHFFADAGAFDNPTIAAHCVYLTEEDMYLLEEKGVSIVHNPCSNLKLGSGVMPLSQMTKHQNLNIAIGTDGAASNNTQDILKELYVSAILHKGIERKPNNLPAHIFLDMATINGAKAQQRKHCGLLQQGCKADLTMIDLNDINNIPLYNDVYTALFSANSSNVCFTMVDGEILYENKAFTKLDEEKIKFEMKEVCAHYFD